MFERIRCCEIAAAMALVLTGAPALAAPKDKDVVVVNDPSEPVPVSVEGTPEVVIVNDANEPVPVSRDPISASGDWQGAGLNLPPMILHDLIFYANSLGDQTSCRISMHYVIDDVTSRRLRVIELALGESEELHYEAGVAASDLRFGTISSTGEQCVVHWAAFGFEAP